MIYFFPMESTMNSLCVELEAASSIRLSAKRLPLHIKSASVIRLAEVDIFLHNIVVNFR